MTPDEEIELVRIRFLAGELPADELILNVEPVLMALVMDAAQRNAVRNIVNDIEEALFSEIDPRTSSRIDALLRDAASFARERSLERSGIVKPDP